MNNALANISRQGIANRAIQALDIGNINVPIQNQYRATSLFHPDFYGQCLY